MLKHSKTLEETALWELYVKKTPEKDSSRRILVKKVYENAVTYLKRVCDTFPNYTLHDEKHVLNVIYAMGAILGDQIDNLSTGEIELLILAAALHDIGIVYDDTDKQNAFKDERKCMRFIKENSPELIGVPYIEWAKDTEQWYLRTLHPFRLHEILRNEEWKDLIDKRPCDVVPMQNIIDLWEWNDKDGNVWFRIDDQGTGMTPGMLKKYFLKVGNSYYTSKELKRDLVNHSNDKDYFGISRFGIGFLSCFLCGIEAEVSTLYFDDSKSKSECDSKAGDRNGYGLRMQITGLSGYYTLRSQADNHIINTSLPAPEFINSVEHSDLEYRGYRSKAGTSIVIKLDPGKLGTINLKDSIEKYIYGTRMPVFYNGNRIGFTYSEIIEAAHKLNGENVYELSDEEKEEYDKTFPNAKGQYPKIVITVVPLDTNEYQVIPNLSGIILKYNVHFDNPPKWQVMDQIYTISTRFYTFNKIKYLYIDSENMKKKSKYYSSSFKRLSIIYGKEKLDTLKQALGKFMTCPASAEELGTAWLPFAENENISEIWRGFVNEDQEAEMHVELNNKINLNTLINNRRCFEVECIYQGIITGDLNSLTHNDSVNATFFLENELLPIVDIGRTKVSALPPEAIVAICGIVFHPNLSCEIDFNLELLINISSLNLHEWRNISDSELGRWMLKTHNKLILQIQEFLQTPLRICGEFDREADGYSIGLERCLNRNLIIMYKFVSAYFQDIYDMEIYYEDGQRIVFTKKGNTEYNNPFDKFPPMMFCKAGSDESRRYLCCSSSEWRRGITLDHPFAQWLVENAVKIEKHFPRQFDQIVDSLCNDDAQEIIKIVNDFRQQLIQLNVCHGIDVTSLRELTNDDFWDPDL